MALQSESARTTEQILSQFHLKTLHAILSARVPQIHGGSPNPSRHRKRDRWFHLSLGDPLPALDHLGFHPMEPLFVDIVLSSRDAPGEPEAIVERWTATCETPALPDNLYGGLLVKKTYSKLMILLRSLYSILRLLPAYRVFRMLCGSNQAYNYDMSYRVSSFAEPFTRAEEAGLRLYSFFPVETVFGQLAVSVQYRPSLAEFSLEVSSLLPPMLITDYVGSPTTDPLRAFPASLPMGGAARPPSRTSSAPVFQQRPHSWTGIPMSHHPLSPTPTTPSPQMAYRLSPTPSPPTFGVNYPQSRLRSETAPVSIPQPASGNSQVHHTPNLSDPTRNFLPPPSPRRVDASPQESASFRKSEGLRVADILSNLYAQKGFKDGRDDSGRFSGVLSSGGSPRFGFSRSSSRLSMQDDLDDADLSCPFAVDDVDSDSQTRSDGKETHSESGQACTSTHKSQDSEVGVLVHMLRTAPALRDHSFSSHSSKNEFDGEGGSSFMSRKTSDAFEELQTYKQIKEILLSRSRAELQDSLKQ
ncbi:autophagy-related protein 13a-like [Typha latifolia]|uniref:autophagy-related protein 13a-like n=1 Tax=Typha latifolia TaxID=4733 RepID=UPI003C2E11C4